MSEVSPPVLSPMELAPGVRRIIAPNPSAMTYWGTNTYLIGQERLIVVDPGPNDPAHFTALSDAIAGTPVERILVTHSHKDHSPLARQLADATGAPVCAFGDSSSGQTALMRRLAAEGLTGGGEGVDSDFAPDVLLKNGISFEHEGQTLTAHHTPGHMGNHMAFEWGGLIFTGDLVMGWASTMVSPPDGDLGDFLQSCERLKGLNAKRLFPGHGDPIEDPQARLNWLLNHRNERTEQILAALQTGPATVDSLTRHIYTDAPEGLLAAAARNVLAHLIHLHDQGRVNAQPSLHFNATFALT